jgi:hypothetical protein
MQITSVLTTGLMVFSVLGPVTALPAPETAEFSLEARQRERTIAVDICTSTLLTASLPIARVPLLTRVWTDV